MPQKELLEKKKGSKEESNPVWSRKRTPRRPLFLFPLYVLAKSYRLTANSYPNYISLVLVYEVVGELFSRFVSVLLQKPSYTVRSSEVHR